MADQGGPGTLDFHLYRVRYITAGESLALTIAPGDSLCFNNVRDFPGLGPDYVCRTVRVVALAAGVLTIEAISSSDGTRPNLAVETVNVPLQWRIEYPASIPVTAGTEVMANIEMATPLLDRQSYLLTSTLALSQP